jgi:ATP-binding cassette subfamily B protein
MLIAILRTYLRPYRLRTAVITVLVLAQVIISLYLPSMNADIINNGVAVGDTDYIWRVGFQMLALTVVSVAFSLAAAYLTAFVSMSFARDMRSAVFRKVLGFNAQDVDRFGTPSLITRNTNDVQQIQVLVTMGLSMLLMAPLTMIGGVVMALRHNVHMSILIVIAVPAMGAVIGIMMSLAIPQFRLIQKRIDRINGVLREQITGMRVIRAFVRDDFEQARFAVANEELKDTSLRINRIFAIAMPALGMILNFSTIGVVWFGSHLVANGEMQIGDISAFLSYLMQILISVMMATMASMLVPRAAASAERIKAVLDVQPEITDPEQPVAQTRPGAIEFRHVQFRYPGAEEAVLNDINFTVEPGQFTAVVGGTGSGKSTLIGLLTRFFDTSEGAVLVGGVDVREQHREALYRSLGLVPQRAYLFGGSVRDNVRFGAPDLTDDEVWRALEIAQAADFVRELENGLDYAIAQGGQNLSGGQKQRMAIARAIARRPQIYVLDDSFSALDAATDARLRSSLQREMADSTVIVVAQRVSTVLHADRIIVLDEGGVAGIGTHDELMATCTAYQEIVGSQMEVSA